MTDEFVEFLNPSSWKRPKGYSNVVSARGRMVFVAGQIGWNSEEVFETEWFKTCQTPTGRWFFACLSERQVLHKLSFSWYFEKYENTTVTKPWSKLLFSLLFRSARIRCSWQGLGSLLLEQQGTHIRIYALF